MSDDKDERRERFEAVAKAEAEASAALELARRALGRLASVGLGQHHTAKRALAAVDQLQSLSVEMHQLTARTPS